jgi:hypothetical protein
LKVQKDQISKLAAQKASSIVVKKAKLKEIDACRKHIKSLEKSLTKSAGEMGKLKSERQELEKIIKDQFSVIESARQSFININSSQASIVEVKGEPDPIKLLEVKSFDGASNLKLSEITIGTADTEEKDKKIREMEEMI